MQSDAALVRSNSNVALFTPFLAPGIFDEEVLGAVGVGAIANGESGMVDVFAATLLDDAASVGSEAVVVGFDGDGDGFVV